MQFVCSKYSLGFGFVFVLHIKKYISKMFHPFRFVFNITKKKELHEVENY